ncbi:MAG: type VI secretion system baseplate subunit TssG, partial [Gemmatimonadota bacterium]|nr:type VI secretion system baseplate subunit TssG [Gemmatimonadota bacterium]
MESPRVTDAATVAALTEEATAYGFFQAVRLVQRLFPERQPVGRFSEPADEVLRFGANPGLAFPPSEIHVLEVYSEPPEMTVNFLGLVGPMGVLPHPYSLQV